LGARLPKGPLKIDARSHPYLNWWGVARPPRIEWTLDPTLAGRSGAHPRRHHRRRAAHA
jgi:hypothetical protein